MSVINNLPNFKANIDDILDKKAVEIIYDKPLEYSSKHEKF